MKITKKYVFTIAMIGLFADSVAMIPSLAAQRTSSGKLHQLALAFRMQLPTEYDLLEFQQIPGKNANGDISSCAVSPDTSDNEGELPSFYERSLFGTQPESPVAENALAPYYLPLSATADTSEKAKNFSRSEDDGYSGDDEPLADSDEDTGNPSEEISNCEYPIVQQQINTTNSAVILEIQERMQELVKATTAEYEQSL